MSTVVTWTKLRSGDFGLRVAGAKPAHGDTLNVTSKAGKTSAVVVDSIIWSGKDRDGSFVHLCSIQRQHRRQGDDAPAPRRRNECPDCGDIAAPGTFCWEAGKDHV